MTQAADRGGHSEDLGSQFATWVMLGSLCFKGTWRIIQILEVFGESVRCWDVFLEFPG